MSRCSEAVPEDAAGVAANGEDVSRLLAAIADELAHTAGEVVKLGETLSGDMTNSDQSRGSYDLQVFDALSQAVQAQAQLLKRLAELGAAASRARITALIDDIPFSNVRQRLRAVANGNPLEAPLTDEKSDSEVSWF
jgi:ATPase subunit of ABC transporter with duplicated ATPase domains